MNAYVARLRGLLAEIPADVLPTPAPVASGAKVRVPTQAFSEFLINREMGDWAERLVADELAGCGLGLAGCAYGRSENLVAGDPGFKEHYLSYHRELVTLGKRPDLLVFRGAAPKADIFSDGSDALALATAQTAVAALEVRSSQQSLEGGRDPGGLSFTPKVEDIHNVMRWIEGHGVPHYYVQVLFGGVYAIAFERILEILARGRLKADFKIESAEKSQFKATYYLPLTSGVRLTRSPDEFVMPLLEAFHRRLPKGRMLFGVKFTGGRAPFAVAALKQLLEA